MRYFVPALLTAMLVAPLASPTRAWSSEPIEALVERLGHSRITTGNRIKLLVEGSQAYEERLELLESARHHVLVSTFLWRRDDYGRGFLDRVTDLIRRRRAVDPEFTALFLFDATTQLASSDPAHRVCRELRRAGAGVRHFNPATWAVASATAARLHDKILIVDGRAAILGGRNLSDGYFDPLEGWLDADVRLEGPAVEELQMHFLKAWSLGDELRRPGRLLAPPERVRAAIRRFWATGRFASGKSPLDPFLTRDFFPAFEATNGGHRVAVLYDNPLVHRRAPSMNLLMELVRRAGREIDLVTPFPNFPGDLLECLESAARRGVRIRLLVNSAETAIHGGLFWRSGITSLKRMLDAGVEVWGWRNTRDSFDAAAVAACLPIELPPAAIHAKVVRIDEELSIVHASNFNYRSTYYNTEAGVLIVDYAFSREVRGWFDRLLGSTTVDCRRTTADVPMQALFSGPMATRITTEELDSNGGNANVLLGFVDSMSPLW